MIQYSNDKIIDNDLLGNFKNNTESNNGFQEGMLALTGTQPQLAIEDGVKKKEDKPSKYFMIAFSSVFIFIILRIFV